MGVRGGEVARWRVGARVMGRDAALALERVCRARCQQYRDEGWGGDKPRRLSSGREAGLDSARSHIDGGPVASVHAPSHHKEQQQEGGTNSSRVEGVSRSTRATRAVLAGHSVFDIAQNVSHIALVLIPHIMPSYRVHAPHVRLTFPSSKFLYPYIKASFLPVRSITSPRCPSHPPTPHRRPSGPDRTSPARSCSPPRASSRSRACRRGRTARPRRLRMPCHHRRRRGSDAPSSP